MVLSEAKKGDLLVIDAVTGDDNHLLAFRFGLNPGAVIKVEQNISGGPVIVSRRQLEVALGQDIAKNILVSRADSYA